MQRLAAAAQQHWDLIVIGGGITGAGILRLAALQGLKVLLLEQDDFASGTSSRSSKLVHGGLRYLAHGKLRLTAESVRERQALLAQAPGLVSLQPFVFPVSRRQRPGLAVTRAGLWLYDALARRRCSRRLSWQELDRYAPGLATRDLAGALYFEDAQTDDARLVLRLLAEGRAAGGQTLNYCRSSGWLRERGRVVGVACEDFVAGGSAELRASQIINATGAWAQDMGGAGTPPMRALRGSHLLFNATRFALPAAVSFVHPDDRRPVFAYSWEGVSLLGTTDLDHPAALSAEPQISPQEVDYLLRAAAHAWPGLGLSQRDVLSTYSGVRSVVDSGAARPSDESREAAQWQEPGLLSVTGGKLTTFRVTALAALQAVGLASAAARRLPIFNAVPSLPCPPSVDPARWRRLAGRYGAELEQLAGVAQAGDYASVAGSVTCWAELRFAAHAEAVQHLDDLLLRRSRLGLILPDACRAQMPRIREVCQAALGWDDRRWGNEEGAWYRRWQEHYHLPVEAAA